MAELELVLAADERALERALVEHVRGAQARLRAARGRDLEPLAIAVASGALREHVMALLARELGAALGVEVLTLAGAARRVLEHAQCSSAAHDLACELLARRAARAEPALASALASGDDDWGLASASIGDLLSAGLARGGGAELGRRFSTAPNGARAAALVRAAAAADDAARQAGLARANDRLEEAAELVERGAARWPGALALYGLDELTGQAARLARALCAAGASRWFALRLGEAPAACERWFPGAPARSLSVSPAPETAAFCAARPRGEARELAERVWRLLDTGSAPERIGVVARWTDERCSAVRRAFDELGVPYSGGSVPPALRPERRTLGAFFELTRAGAEAPLDRWLEARSAAGHAAPLSEVALALRLHGVASVGALARAPFRDWSDGRGRVALPARGAARAEDAEADANGEAWASGEPASARSARWSASLGDLTAESGRAAAFLAAAQAAGSAPLAEAIARLRAAAGCIADPDSPLARALESAARELLGQVPAELAVDSAEAAWLLERALLSAVRPLGGRGAGVRLLAPEEARGITFEHLFLLGANRGELPALAREDPLLRDRERGALRAVLAELELGRERGERERTLFRRLLASADRVTLSWLTSDADDRPRSRAPIVQALCLERAIEPHTAPPRRELERAAGVPRTEREHWLAAALARPRAALGALGAFGAFGALRGGRAALVAEHRLRALDARDAPARRAEDAARVGELLPFDGRLCGGDGRLGGGDGRLGRGDGRLGGGDGVLGRGARPARGARIAVTRLERTARCPWRAHLERDLGLEPLPDPLSTLPDVDAAALGNAVHAALERLLGRAPGRVARPTAAELSEALLAASERALADVGVHLRGLARGLALCARPYVERALELAFAAAGAGDLEVLATEARREIDLGQVALEFRADLVLGPEGDRTLVDFKTGRPLSAAIKAATRAQHLAAAVARGTSLQAAVYAAWAAGAGGGRGTYLYLDPALELDAARLTVEGSDLGAREDMERATAALAAALHAGLAPPFLEDPRGKAGECEHCPVDRACLRHDSAARARLARLLNSAADLAPAPAANPALAPADTRTALADLARLWAEGTEA